jgi:acyl CoA:acetate/3-ketoacid CoA transferase beta subunit
VIGERERFVARLAREVRDGDVVNVATPLTATAAFLARETHAPNATILWHGIVDPALGPLPGPRELAHPADGVACYGQAEALRLIEAGHVTLMFISPAQVDARGAVNASRVGGSPLPGGIGTADLVSLVGRIVVYKTGRSLRALVREVEYVTGSPEGNLPGRAGVTRIVTSAGVVALVGGAARLVSLAPGSSAEAFRAAGMEIAVPAEVEIEPEPSPEELRLIRRIDPRGLGDLELGRLREAALRRLVGEEAGAGC